ncbi:MAG: DNA translocase FtsK 4TM domain-containing protein [Paludibacteraceae bacterium]|nr:DNA translocase FtsK 4TM domain-containing protein [Paludibacteraceae bacterium]
MARRVTRPTTPSNSGSKEATTNTNKLVFKDYFLTTRDMVMSNRFQLAMGIILIAVTLMLLIAFISFFFTGSNDYSILEQADGRRAMRGEIQNALGLPGAVIARWMIDGTFGIVSLSVLVAIALYAIRMIVAYPLKRWRLFFITIFTLLWGSITLGFAQQMIGAGSFFRWGGKFGTFAAQGATSYIQWVGLLLTLIAVLIVFLIVVDQHFVEHCQQFGMWIKRLFTKRNTTEEIENTVSSAEEDSENDNIIDIILDEPEYTDEEEENHLVDIPQLDITPLEIEPLSTEPEHEEETEEEETEEEEETDVDISVEAVKEVELSEDDPNYLFSKLGPYDPRKDLEHYTFPSLSLLKVYDNETAPVINQEEQQANANRIVTTLRNYGIEIESIKATVGPTVTLYEIVPVAGVRVSKIQNLENDIMLSLSAMGIRIIAPIPGKGTIGIEVPNENPQIVSMHSVIASKRFQEEKKMKLPIAYGRTITNDVFMFDLAKTPHLLVAGATGTGKSVAINAIITSLLYKKHPAELKLVMVDPKMVEFAPYKPLLRHYLAAMPDTDPEQVVITDCDKVINTLNSLVIEMENRYKLLMDAGVRNLEDYNDKFVSRRLNPEKLIADSLHHQYLPYIVIIIDEYGDFIMQAGKQVETPIARITQKARAVGMHMILATQRPSVNIVTGVIKANIPTRMALRTQSVVDSRTVLDTKGAEQLIGRGDSLYAGNASITRVQCAFVDTPEVDAIVEHIEKQQHYFEPYQLPEYIPEGGEGEALAPGAVDLKRLDPMFADVARYVVTKQEGSTSRLQRAFEIGYNRAGKLSDQLEAAGIVGPNKGPKGRDVLIQSLDELDKKLQELGC